MATDATRHLASTVGGNIRAARENAGLTQHQLAVKMGRGDAMAVSRWERGANRPTDVALLRLSEVLERPVAWFYRESDEERVA